MRLGQHFLRDPAIARRIAAALPLQPEDVLVEIGPGRGVMTRLLAGRCCKLVGIEVDPALAVGLQAQFQCDSRVEILQRDILGVNLGDLCGNAGARACYVFGNLPYYITSPILHHVFGFWRGIRHASFVMQREVADRLAAAPGNRAYGYLTVFVQSFSRPKIVFEIPPGAFSPPPKVRSALVDFTVAPRFPDWNDERNSAFLKFAQLAFSHKRKSLLNNLAPQYSRGDVERTIEELGLTQRARAEEIGIERLAELFQMLCNSASMWPRTAPDG